MEVHLCMYNHSTASQRRSIHLEYICSNVAAYNKPTGTRHIVETWKQDSSPHKETTHTFKSPIIHVPHQSHVKRN